MSFLNAMHSSRSHDAVIRVYKEAGDTRLEMHKHTNTAPISFYLILQTTIAANTPSFSAVWGNKNVDARMRAVLLTAISAGPVAAPAWCDEVTL